MLGRQRVRSESVRVYKYKSRVPGTSDHKQSLAGSISSRPRRAFPFNEGIRKHYSGLTMCCSQYRRRQVLALLWSTRYGKSIVGPTHLAFRISLAQSQASNHVTACTKLACLAYACCGIDEFTLTANPCGAWEYRFVWNVTLFAFKMLSALDLAVALKVASSAMFVSHRCSNVRKLTTYCLQQYSTAQRYFGSPSPKGSTDARRILRLSRCRHPSAIFPRTSRQSSSLLHRASRCQVRSARTGSCC